MDQICRVITPVFPEQRSAADGLVLRAPQFLEQIDIPLCALEGKTLIRPRDHLGFTSIDNLGVDAGTLQGRVMYDCPWTGNRYYWMYPLGVVTGNDDGWRYGPGGLSITPAIYPANGCVDPRKWGGIVDAMLGHGYIRPATPPTPDDDASADDKVEALPDKGHGSKVLATIQLQGQDGLNHGDKILVACWIWYSRPTTASA